MEPGTRSCLVIVDVQRDFCDDQLGATLGVRHGGKVAGLIGDHLRSSIDDYDLVVLTGDFITTKSDSVSAVAELLGRLEVQPVAVLGNHDHWTDVWRRTWRSSPDTSALRKLAIDWLTVPRPAALLLPR